VAKLFQSGETFDVALIDITMSGMNGLDLLKIIKKNSPDTECIMISALNEAQLAVDCMKTGAYDYLVKPISHNELSMTLNRALERKRFLAVLNIQKDKTEVKLSNTKAFSDIITLSPRIKRILKEAELHAASSVPVLITGDSGTGKELLAQAVHRASPRKNFKFSAINMASMSPTLFDSEFFGHTKGAYTGADKDRKGYLETTDKGTLFLDEIGHMPMDLQGKLLRVLQEGEYLKLGTDTVKKADIRIIAATNANLEMLIKKGMFRKDLYYRLKGAWLFLPPLKNRREDIYPLIKHFLKKFDIEDSKPDEKTLSLLTSYDYPGNIRELKSILQSALNLSEGKKITLDHLPLFLKKNRKEGIKKDPDTTMKTLAQVEKDHILKTYGQAYSNKSKTAKILEIGLNTLRRKLSSYGVE
jgi:DNA-binding NtrC family response regulator